MSGHHVLLFISTGYQWFGKPLVLTSQLFMMIFLEYGHGEWIIAACQFLDLPQRLRPYMLEVVDEE